MRARSIGLILPGGLALCVALACASGRRGAPVAPAVDLDSPLLARGEQIYMRNCQQCHPGGDAGLGPAIVNKPLPKGLMATQVRVGLGAMPGFTDAEIDDAELEALLAYLVALRAAPPPPAETGEGG